MAGRFRQFPVGAVDYASVATGPRTTREAVSFELRLFSYEAQSITLSLLGIADREPTI